MPNADESRSTYVYREGLEKGDYEEGIDEGRGRKKYIYDVLIMMDGCDADSARR